MTRVAAWVGAGVFTAGLSAAMLAGAGTAHADDDGASKKDTKSAATHSDTRQRSQRHSERAAKHRPTSKISNHTAATKVKATQRTAQTEKSTQTEESDRSAPQRADSGAGIEAKARAVFRDSARNVETKARDVEAKVPDVAQAAPEPTPAAAAAKNDAAEPTAEIAAESPADVVVRPVIDVRAAARSAVSPLREHLQAERKDAAVAQRDITTMRTASTTATPNDPVEAIHDVLRSLGGLVLNPEPQDYPAPLSAFGDIVFDTLATLERAVGGDPVVPPELRDAVEVSTSTLVVSEGHEVESNWYIPTSDSDDPPTRLIYLQHGFLANGPLYSYTASYLATQTNSIVVTTTYTSNPFEADGMWLGGDNLHAAVAELFLDPDRKALNTSLDTAELKAGRTTDLDVPMQFVLVGHSLGGGFAPGVAGYYAEGLSRRRQAGFDAPNDLAGVVAYDAVPMGSIVPDAMARLDELEASGDPNDYIPIYEIGAPLNYLNVFSDVNDQLTEARPGQFTGVVLQDGVHMDPMQGANPLIQVAAYVIAGFPQPQNPLAVRELSAGWINDMFDERIDPETGACASDCAGYYGEDSFTISTPEGEAVAVPIGTPEATHLASLHNISLTDFISAIPAGVLNGLETTCDLFSGGSCAV
ncbi:hypothetical protein FR943_21800 [Mycobacterium sp. TNTM28]|uniref:Alpha/beta hydrolase n=1 Tax=[Mycobacterium] fortunisiensis TaxID=2600579 RepID=A0ABS6KS61_9MYCO|nr:hypothetical protein [[Mycobacterium] fortunisiensis]MBU9766466.1 hypothetical protein [[Mycobacterium] fortunisiensis]